MMSKANTMVRVKLSEDEQAEKTVAFSQVLGEVRDMLEQLKGVDKSEAEDWDIENDLDGPYPSMMLSVRYYGYWFAPNDDWDAELVLSNKDGMAIDRAFQEIKNKHGEVDMYWKASDKCGLYFIVRPIPVCI